MRPVRRDRQDPRRQRANPGRYAASFFCALGICSTLLAMTLASCSNANPRPFLSEEPTKTLVREEVEASLDPLLNETPQSPRAFAYLPLQREIAISGVGDEVALAWEGQALRVKLLQIQQAGAGASIPPGAKGFVTTLVLWNDDDQDITLPLNKLFSGMNSSGRPLDGGGAVHLAGPVEARIAAGNSVQVDLLWYTKVYQKDTSIWLTLNLPIHPGGYIPLGIQGHIFAFSLSQVDYPLGTPTPCALAATFVRETVADNAPFAPEQRFDKTWVIQNSGTCHWAYGSSWEHVAGENMGVTKPLALDGLPGPGGLLTVTLSMTAPLALGIHRGDWRMRAPSGDFYGRPFYVQITVTDTLEARR